MRDWPSIAPFQRRGDDAYQRDCRRSGCRWRREWRALAALSPAPDCAERHGSEAAAAAAKAFLASLPADLRKQATFPLDSPERIDWYFVPRDRVGVSLLKLDDAQSELLGPLLATALSPEGLLEARGVIKHENILRRVETEAGAAMPRAAIPACTTPACSARRRAPRPGPGASKGTTFRSM